MYPHAGLYGASLTSTLSLSSEASQQRHASACWPVLLAAQAVLIEEADMLSGAAGRGPCAIVSLRDSTASRSQSFRGASGSHTDYPDVEYVKVQARPASCPLHMPLLRARQVFAAPVL